MVSVRAHACCPAGFRHSCLDAYKGVVPFAAAKVAVLSAKEHSPNLIPVLLYGGSSGEASAAAHENILWFREQGGIVYHHNLTFMSNLQVSTYCKP